jgi:hypothetical protein
MPVLLHLFQVLGQLFWFFILVAQVRLKNCVELQEINSLQLNLVLPELEQA